MYAVKSELFYTYKPNFLEDQCQPATKPTYGPLCWKRAGTDCPNAEIPLLGASLPRASGWHLHFSIYLQV